MQPPDMPSSPDDFRDLTSQPICRSKMERKFKCMVVLQNYPFSRCGLRLTSVFVEWCIMWKHLASATWTSGVLSKTPAQKRDTFILLLTCFNYPLRRFGKMARFSFFAQIFTQHPKDGAGTNPRGRKGLSNTDGRTSISPCCRKATGFGF